MSSDNSVIQQVKNLLVSSFDSTLPNITLEYFLTYETDGAPATWSVTQCDEHSPAAPDSPACIQADFDLNGDRALTVVVTPGKSKNQPSHGAAILRLTITEATGNVRLVRRLGELPMELHRRLAPARPARDLPPPVQGT